MGGRESPRVLLAGAMLVIDAACGVDERISAPSAAGQAGKAGSGGASAGAGFGGTSGLRGDASGGTTLDAAVDVIDADASDANANGCIDIHVTHSSLPPDPTGWSQRGPAIGVYSDRDHLWRDSRGIHVAWSATHADGKIELVVSSYDASGASLGHRFFRSGGRKGFGAVGVAPDGTVGIAVALEASDAGIATYALLVLRADDTSKEQTFPIPEWALGGTRSVVGVGWDGEAFAVHGFAADNTQYVTRIKADGSVLLAPTAFGSAYGYQHEIRYVTDPVSGVSVGVSGRGASVPWVTGHLRDGTPTPDPARIQGFELKPQGFKRDAGWAGGVIWPAVRAVAGGAAVAWSHGDAGATVTTFIQTLGTDLAPTSDVIGLPGEKLTLSDYDYNEWPTLQARPGGWWLAGSNTGNVNEYLVANGALARRRLLVTYSKGGRERYAVDQFESAAYNDELWLGFRDASNTTGMHEQPYRVVLAKPGCSYRSMYDLEVAP